MRALISLGFGLLATATLTTTALAEPVLVHQKDKAFAPGEITIKAGDEVAFVNDDKVVHSVFIRDGGYKISKVQKPGQKTAVKFDKPGEVHVRCAIHPAMKLKIIVK